MTAVPELQLLNFKEVGKMNGLFSLAKTGTMGDAAEFLTQLFGGTLGTVFSYAINITAIGLTIAYVIKAVLAFIKYKGESNPNQAEISKKEAINCLIVAGVSISLGVLINLILGIFGISVFSVK